MLYIPISGRTILYDIIDFLIHILFYLNKVVVYLYFKKEKKKFKKKMAETYEEVTALHKLFIK